MSIQRTRVLLLSPLPPPSGGISNWTLAVSRSPLAERFELRVVNSAPSRNAQVSGASRPTLDRALDLPCILGRFTFELVRFRPRVVHINTSFFWGLLRDGAAVWLAKGCGAAAILHLRGGDFPEWVDGMRPLRRHLVLATLRRCDRVVALTKPTERWLEGAIGTKRVAYLPNFVAIEAAQSVPRGAPGDGVAEILFVGWRIAAKGVRELLTAMRDVPNAHLTLMGPEEPAFSESVQPLIDALGERLRMLPAQPREAVARAMASADVFVLPTWREGFPNVVLEAMAAGLAIVATPAGAIPEAIEDEVSGLLVPVRDVARLRDAIRRLVEDPALRRRLGAAAQARARELYSFDTVSAHLAQIWSDAAN